MTMSTKSHRSSYDAAISPIPASITVGFDFISTGAESVFLGILWFLTFLALFCFDDHALCSNDNYC